MSNSLITTLTRAIGAGALAVALGCALPAVAGEINVQKGVAIAGYDPVAYFEEGRPVLGSSAHSTAWKGATFHFSSEARRAAFTADPERYAPQYGGFCAYGTAQGYKAKIDPTAFTLVDGKLYLNYDSAVQATWRADVTGFVATADANWPTVKEQ